MQNQKLYRCERCKDMFGDEILYAIITSVEGTTFKMLCPTCAKTESSLQINRRVKVFDNQLIKRSFE